MQRQIKTYVRKNATDPGNAEETALGTEEKLKMFVEKGTEVYAKV